VPSLLRIKRGQSERNFDEDSSGQYREAALVAASITKSGRVAFNEDLARRLPGWTVNAQGGGNGQADQVGWGGTSFVDEWIDPRVSPGDNTPLSGNTDARLMDGATQRYGSLYFDTLDSLLAAHAPSADAIEINWFRQTWESDDRAAGNGGAFLAWPFDVAQYARAISLFVALEKSKVAAYGKPYRITITHPGATERGGGNHALMREVTQHLAVNGRRSTRAALASFPVIENFYVSSSASIHVTFGTAQQADTASAGSDFAHQSMGSSIRTGRAMALETARWLSPSTPQEFDAHPYVHSAFRVAGQPNLVRVRVRITPGNRLIWQGPAPEDTDVTVYGGFSSLPKLAHLFVHNATIDNNNPPSPLGASGITVDNSQAASGWAFINVQLSAAVPSPCYLTHGPSENSVSYTRRTEAIATTLKRKVGLYEDGTPAKDLVVDAALSDVLRSPIAVAMPVFPVTNLLVAAEDPVTMALQLSVGARNAALDAIEAAIGTSPTLEFRTGAQPADCASGDSGTLLGTLTLPADWMSAASGGAKGLAGTWSGTGSAAGTIGHFRIKRSGGACDMQRSVTGTGGGGQCELSSVGATVGGAISITGWNLTGPNP
jgi:hypothetical protein